MPTALLLIGRGRYEDPWHDYAATGQRVAQELSSFGLSLQWRSTFPDTFDGMQRPALIVVLAGRRPAHHVREAENATWEHFHSRLAEFAFAGTALLALHSAANTFADSPHWSRLIGGRWVEGKSTHPPIGEAVFDSMGAHPIVSGMGSIHAYDEQYLDLEIAPTSQPFLASRQASAVHSVAWVAAPTGQGKTVYDGLGHDTRSYDSDERIALLRREISWLLAEELRR